nr:uncharacterized protein LOC125184680 isoform X2 [Anser cygnoides]
MAAGAGAGGAATPAPRQLSSPCAAVSPKHERRHGALWFVVPSAGAGFFLRVEYLGVGIRGRRGASEGPPPTLSITEMVKTQIFLPDVGPCQQADMSSAPSDSPHSCRQRRVGRTHPSWGHRVLRGDTVSFVGTPCPHGWGASLPGPRTSGSLRSRCTRPPCRRPGTSATMAPLGFSCAKALLATGLLLLCLAPAALLVLQQPQPILFVEPGAAGEIGCILDEELDGKGNVLWYRRVHGEQPRLILSCIQEAQEGFSCEYTRQRAVLHIAAARTNHTGLYLCAYNVGSILKFGNGTALVVGDSWRAQSWVRVLAPHGSPSDPPGLVCAVGNASGPVLVSWPGGTRAQEVLGLGGSTELLISPAGIAGSTGGLCEVRFNASGPPVRRSVELHGAKGEHEPGQRGEQGRGQMGCPPLPRQLLRAGARVGKLKQWEWCGPGDQWGEWGHVGGNGGTLAGEGGIMGGDRGMLGYGRGQWWGQRGSEDGWDNCPPQVPARHQVPWPWPQPGRCCCSASASASAASSAHGRNSGPEPRTLLHPSTSRES